MSPGRSGAAGPRSNAPAGHARPLVHPVPACRRKPRVVLVAEARLLAVVQQGGGGDQLVDRRGQRHLIGTTDLGEYGGRVGPTAAATLRISAAVSSNVAARARTTSRSVSVKPFRPVASRRDKFLDEERVACAEPVDVVHQRAVDHDGGGDRGDDLRRPRPIQRLQIEALGPHAPLISASTGRSGWRRCNSSDRYVPTSTARPSEPARVNNENNVRVVLSAQCRSSTTRRSGPRFARRRNTPTASSPQPAAVDRLPPPGLAARLGHESRKHAALTADDQIEGPVVELARQAGDYLAQWRERPDLFTELHTPPHRNLESPTFRLAREPLVRWLLPTPASPPTSTTSDPPRATPLQNGVCMPVELNLTPRPARSTPSRSLQPYSRLWDA